MKLIVRILNFVIMGLSLAAAVLLFAKPAFSFNSNIALDVKKLSSFVPETQYTKDIDIVNSLGTDEIQVAIKFSLNLGGVAKSMGGNRQTINDSIVSKNVDDIVTTMHEPVDLITDYSIRSIIKSTIKDEITKQIDAAKTGSGSTAQEIMDESGIDDKYFTNFAFELYNSTNEDGATTESVSNVLYWQIDEAINKAQQSGQPIDTTKYKDKLNDISTNMTKVLTDLKLVKSDGTLVKLSEVSYFYLSTYLKDELVKQGQDPVPLEQKAGETIPQYADRLITTYVLTQMPDAFYKTVGGVCVGLFIGIFLFTGIWLFLFGWTLFKSLTKKPYTFFGPIFWAVGSLQLVLGLGLTIFGKFIFPTIKFNMGQIPIKSIILAPRTYALVPSILFLVAIPLAVIYLIFKIIAKSQDKQTGGNNDEK